LVPILLALQRNCPKGVRRKSDCCESTSKHRRGGRPGKNESFLLTEIKSNGQGENRGAQGKGTSDSPSKTNKQIMFEKRTAVTREKWQNSEGNPRRLSEKTLMGEKMWCIFVLEIKKLSPAGESMREKKEAARRERVAGA